GYTPGTGSMVFTTDSSYTITQHQSSPLVGGLCYDVYFYSYCGGTQGFITGGPYTICTPCDPALMPYSENFTVWPPSCVTYDEGEAPWMHYMGTNGEWAEANFWSLNDVDYEMDMRIVDVSVDALVRFD